MPAGASSNVNDTGSSSAETSLAVVEPHVVEGPVPYEVEVQGGVGIRLFYLRVLRLRRKSGTKQRATQVRKKPKK